MADTQRDQYKFPMSLRTAMQRAGVLLENFSDVRRREFCEDDQHVMRAALDELDEAWSDSALASSPAEVDDEGLRGWKLVPVELTEDMLIAFAEAWYSKKRCIDDCEMADCYAAMLAAAPDHFTDVGNMVSDNARMSFIEKNVVRGSTYKGITSANIVVWEIEWRELGLRRAIDAAMSRISHTTNKEKD